MFTVSSAETHEMGEFIRSLEYSRGHSNLPINLKVINIVNSLMEAKVQMTRSSIFLRLFLRIHKIPRNLKLNFGTEISFRYLGEKHILMIGG